MAQEEPFPVHETVKVLEGVTLSKSGKWWSACLLVESYGRRQIALYLWNKSDDGKWNACMHCMSRIAYHQLENT